MRKLPLMIVLIMLLTACSESPISPTPMPAKIGPFAEMSSNSDEQFPIDDDTCNPMRTTRRQLYHYKIMTKASLYSKRWQAKHPQQARDNVRRWQAANPDKLREIRRRYEDLHKEQRQLSLLERRKEKTSANQQLDSFCDRQSIRIKAQLELI